MRYTKEIEPTLFISLQEGSQHFVDLLRYNFLNDVEFLLLFIGGELIVIIVDHEFYKITYLLDHFFPDSPFQLICRSEQAEFLWGDQLMFAKGLLECVLQFFKRIHLQLLHLPIRTVFGSLFLIIFSLLLEMNCFRPKLSLLEISFDLSMFWVLHRLLVWGVIYLIVFPLNIVLKGLREEEISIDREVFRTLFNYSLGETKHESLNNPRFLLPVYLFKDMLTLI